MKRLLLFSMVLMAATSLLAQNTQNTQNSPLFNVPQKASVLPSLFYNDLSIPSFNQLQSKNNAFFIHHSVLNSKTALTRSSSNISFYEIGTSSNANTLLHSQSTCLSANQDLNLLMFVYRTGAYFTGVGGNSGWINTSYSIDGGTTWDTTIIAPRVGNSKSGAGDTLCRYPSGIIYNPAGNTTPSLAYSITSGPYTNDTLWSGYYYGSSRLDSTHLNQQVYPVDSPNVVYQFFPDVATAVAGKYVYVIGSDQYVSAGAGGPNTGLFYGSVLNKATFNSANDTFAWSQRTIHIPIAINPLDADTATISTDQYTSAISSSDMAWSASGDTGYIVQFGVDSAQFASAGTAGWFPIVYKTTDSGQTWNKLPYFHFDTSTNIVAMMSGYLPYIGAINGSKCVVDNKNNLHIYTDIERAGSNNPDSLGFLYFLPSFLFDLSTSDGVTWNNTFVDSILSAAGVSIQWDVTSGVGGVDAQARIQAALTPDHSKAFVTWLDSNPGDDGYNDYPDIFSKGFDFNDGYKTPTVNFTGNSNYAEECYFLYVSTTAFSNNGTYTIPATISETADGSYLTNDPMQHYFVSGITFTDSDFNATGTSGIPMLAGNNLGITIYPSPTSGDLNIAFKNYSGKSSIIVTNILGSVVKQFNNINIAGNTTSLNLEDLQSGIYFVRVETAQGSETQKIVIAKN